MCLAGPEVSYSGKFSACIIGDNPAKTWDLLLIVYCFIASVMPVWILLQPRDYLSSFLLYGSVLGGFAGILFGGFSVSYPAFNGWVDPQLGGLFPILFITVACGACSGFHAVVASGTSSKQLDKESDAKPVAYGAMLIEGIVAVIALITVAMIAKDDPISGKAPLVIYGTGISKFLSVFGDPGQTWLFVWAAGAFDVYSDDSGYRHTIEPVYL